MPLPPDDVRAKLAQLRNEFAMRAALQSEYDKEMSGKYIHQMIPFEDWLAQRNAPTGKAKGGSMTWQEFKKHLHSQNLTDSFGPVEDQEKSKWASAAERWELKTVDPRTLKPVSHQASNHPVIIAPDGDVLDGRNRIAHAVNQGHKAVNAWVGLSKASGGSVMGINVASDRKAGRRYADLIVDGHKTLESRNGDSLRPYVGKRVAIVRTGEGPAKAIGEVTIGEPMVVNKKKFRSLEGQHHVPEGSAYDISTPTKHLYPLHDPVRYEKERDVGHGIVSRKVVHEASGGSVPSLDVMRLAIGGQGPRNWLKGSVEKVIKPLKSAYDPDYALEDLRRLRQQYGELPAYARDEQTMHHAKAINQWVERNLGNYIRKQLGHPNDPIRKLAEEGVLHTDPTRVEIIGGDNDMGTHANRRREMFGGQKMAKGPLAQAWEDAVDTRFEGYKIKDLQNMPEMHEGQYEPWMDKADPNTLIFEPYAFDELGFDHIVDILKEDLAQGRIRPEQLSKVSIEQAVRRTHEVDQANKKAMTESSLKTTEGMPVHKDYGNGFKWIELAMPEMPKELPEGWTMKVPKSGLMRASKPDPVDPRNDITRLGEDLPDLIKNIYSRHPETPGNPFQKLKDALAYESDVMGHCVGGERLPDGTRTGGYANDVKAGNTRIFSLRDAKNEPHVTIEVRPPHHDRGFIGNQRPTGGEYYELRDEYVNGQRAGTISPDLTFAEWWRAKNNIPEIDRNSMPPTIRQIKGKQNAKPKKDYIPYVQDFVKSGNWSEVDDIQNAEMHRAGSLYTNNERKNLERLTGEKMDYVAHQDIPKHRELLKQHNVPPLLPEEKAHGGEVDAEEVFMGKGGKVKELEQYLRQREGEYGVKRLQRAADEIPGLENMYDYEALRSAFGGDNAQALMTMNPADFEKFAHRLGSEEDESAYEGGMTREQYLNKLIRIARAKGFRDVPFLDVGKRKPTYLPSIEGHEGRHRTRALAKMGEQKTLVRLFPTPSMREPMPRRYREDFIEAMKKELGEKRLVTPEGRSLLPADLTAQEHRNLENRNLVASNRPQLPEIYKDGGDVDPESVFFPKSKE